MNTLLFIGAGVILSLVVIAKIPGLEHTVRPLIDLLFTGLKVAIENLFSWSIWLFKVLVGSHMELFQNLIFSAETLDPTVLVKENEA